MARSKDTFNKKDFEKRKRQKRKEKEAKREARKSADSRSFDDMIAYIDENGNLVSTPPDPTKKKKEVDASEIVLGSRNSREFEEEVDPIRRGKVSYFNMDKGYGFIIDSETQDSVFVHINDLKFPLKEQDRVTFETEKGPKGLKAFNVNLQM
ncbi:cold shock domain-containing protein [Pontibacter sp. G13]|uniref:cold-shock protein n=1 Tax=Pontibacter sp. G13 TaxID=3074898 RepID=UPI00288AED19|nr:cold shock domain-containing protein [Pontibacter sp. G13]WNJ17928.1 cold shock domain-containing protein [Pontibacter sp. G13]